MQAKRSNFSVKIPSLIILSLGWPLIVTVQAMACETSCTKLEVMHSYGPTQRGETLWHIADELRSTPHSSRQQVMIMLLALNPQAFSNPCNMHSLRSGVILTAPTPAQATVLTRQHAALLYQQQNQQQPVTRKTTDSTCGELLDTLRLQLADAQKTLTPEPSPLLPMSVTPVSPVTQTVSTSVMASTALAATPLSPLAFATPAELTVTTVLPDSVLRGLIVMLVMFVSLVGFLLWQAFLQSDAEQNTNIR